MKYGRIFKQQTKQKPLTEERLLQAHNIAEEAKKYRGWGGGTMEIVKVCYYPIPPLFPLL